MFTVLLLCVFLIIIFYFIHIWSKSRSVQDVDAPACSKSLPIIGVTHLLLTDTIKFWDTLQMFARDAQKQGGVIRLNIGFHTHYAITDPEDATTVANTCLDKHFVYKFAECWLGKSLFTAPASIWKPHRKLLNPAFSLPVIHGFLKIFNGQARALVDEWEPMAKAPMVPFKATSYIQQNILRGSCLAVFGSGKIHDEKIFRSYSYAVKEMFHVLTQRFLKIWQYSDLIYKLCGQKAKQDRLIKIVTNISDGIIQRAQDENHKDISRSDDRETDVRTFLDMYLELNANNGNMLSMKELREQIDVTILTSYDTTAAQLEIVLLYIGTYPEVQERMFEEIIQIIGPEKDVDKEDLNKLVYTDAVIKEILRLLPMGPVIARSVDKDVKLKNCTMRAGTNAAIMLSGVNRSPSWGPDADQFRPERWLEPGGVPAIASAFATFSIGKRNCIGKTYAMTALKVTVVHLLRKYRIEADHTKVRYQLDIVLRAVKGNEIVLKCR